MVSLQYAQQPGASSEPEDLDFMGVGDVYDSLTTALTDLRAHCPLDGVPIIYHGFSRGSAISFDIALHDRGPEGMRAFAAFISDSGSSLAAGDGQPPDYVLNSSSDAYNGVHFWLYCGAQDHDGMTCEGMDKMAELLPMHGATVELFQYQEGGHGIFIRGRDEATTPAIEAMLEYIDSNAYLEAAGQ